MVKCQVCGEEVGDAKFCNNCGSEVVVKKEEPKIQVENVSNNQKSANILQVAPGSINKNNALLLGIIFTGVGHIYCGLTRRGILFLICAIIGFFLLYIPAIIVWIYSIYDLSQKIEALNNGEAVEDTLFGF